MERQTTEKCTTHETKDLYPEYIKNSVHQQLENKTTN